MLTFSGETPEQWKARIDANFAQLLANAPSMKHGADRRDMLAEELKVHIQHQWPVFELAPDPAWTPAADLISAPQQSITAEVIYVCPCGFTLTVHQRVTYDGQRFYFDSPTEAGRLTEAVLRTES